MHRILKKVGRGIKEFMDEKLRACQELLISAQNRLIIGLVMVGAGAGLIASVYIRAPKE
ncbi:hypothetical protein [Marvinbryantia formatexigens]|nr:hypothetical protein [Marvinbryantia formatexigens]UWO24064.1 GTP-binding protein [Marvinbryantia formatexigens DSM 14469]SDG64800.1 hypothetical protein SAMN05660368_02981 [Marvinbryantia formatexigens]